MNPATLFKIAEKALVIYATIKEVKQMIDNAADNAQGQCHQ